MSFNWKRIALLIGFLLAIVSIGYGLYFVFLKPSIPGERPDGEANLNVNGGLPQAGVNGNISTISNINGRLQGNGNVNGGTGIIIPRGTPTDDRVSEIASGGLTKSTPLTSERAQNITLSADGGSILFYDRNSGLFYKIDENGQRVPITDKAFYEVDDVTWAADKDKAILEYPDGSNILYNFDTKEQVTLPQHWKDFSFSPNGEKIVLKSMGVSESNRWLAISNADGSKAQKIESLGDKDATVYPDWSNNSQIAAMYTEDKSFDSQSLYFIGTNNENFRGTTIEGRGFQSQWSTKGDILLYSVYSSATDYKPSLWIVGTNVESIGQNRKSLRLQTWADKCTFSNNETVYCAVPQELQKAAGIFSNDLDTSPTDIYKIDLKTGIRTKIATPEGDHNIDTLLISDSESDLYFTNKDDGRLYNIDLR